jgi:hypothetical protein
MPPVDGSDLSHPPSLQTPHKTAYSVYLNPAREKITIDFENELLDQVVIKSESAMKQVKFLSFPERR